PAICNSLHLLIKRRQETEVMSQAPIIISRNQFGDGSILWPEAAISANYDNVGYSMHQRRSSVTTIYPVKKTPTKPAISAANATPALCSILSPHNQQKNWTVPRTVQPLVVVRLLAAA
ncbi:MAG: hypothetical protein WAM76_19310, partial [Pseudolabrys sp.]